MPKNTRDFLADFELLTGNRPFPWQIALFERFVAGAFPSSCNLPTGLGKTAVIPIWLLALAEAPSFVPRRLVYVVNRRTVVDQATRETEFVREALVKDAELCQKLRTLCAFDCNLPLAISTLRGQFADNAEWRLDPARPAVIVGTVDMIGSRLLFSGYRCGFKSRPLHAGFMGQDVLLIHDEAHLEPAFQTLLVAIEKEQQAANDSKKLRVIELTATSRGTDKSFSLSAEDQKVAEVRKRLNAKKEICLHAIDDEKKLADKMAELALAHRDSGHAILVFVRRVEDVEKISKKLTREATVQLTGTLRGLERDRQVEHPVFVRFMPPRDRPKAVTPKEGTVYLVCTSAGEVGVNISTNIQSQGGALVCDLSTFESLAQRFGRVNRFGDGKATIDIVHPTKFTDDELEKRRKLTLNLLKQLNGDGSPAALGELPVEERQAAFAPPPIFLPTSGILFDAWALTTIHCELPGRPPVADYLHGRPEDEDWEPPVTEIAWREEVGLHEADVLVPLDPEALLEDYPLKPHEMLHDRSDRVFKHLERIAASFPESPSWLISDDQIEVVSLSALIARGKEEIENATVLLPPSVGGLTLAGMLGDEPTRPGLDVADEWYVDEARTAHRRIRVWSDGATADSKTNGMRLIRSISVNGFQENDGDDQVESPPTREWNWYVRPAFADDDGSKTALSKQLLDPHNKAVGQIAGKMAAALGLPKQLVKAVEIAGSNHDLGKNRRLWQLSIGNANPDEVWAKSGNRRPPEIRIDYRHEFGSLSDVEQNAEFKKLDDEGKDLVRHLIAAHHGRGRPHFPADEAFDPKRPDEQSMSLARQVPDRYARLQRKYGRWGLAYLESLLRAADAYASSHPEGGAK